jgi:hypothetical protein
MRRRSIRGRFLRRRLERRLAGPVLGGPVERRFVTRRGRRLWIGTLAAILLFGNSAIKLRQEDLSRIEGETGKDASELSEQELADAMQKLGIERMELSQDDLILVKKTESRPSLPSQCSGCGAPLSPENLRWHDPNTAECLHCGTVIRVD